MRAARILSRSIAMTRMRWFMRSRASIGMAIVSTVAKAQIAASIVTMKVGFMKLS